MKKLYIIPGYGESTESVGYQTIRQIAKNKGYKVVLFNPSWKHNTLKDWLLEFDMLLKNDKDEENTVLGFSFGALIAVVASQNHKFKKMILCSLSPYFQDDVLTLPQVVFKVLGKKRMDIFSKTLFPKNVAVPAVFLVGDGDIPAVLFRVEKSFTQWTCEKQLKILNGVVHDINHPVYFDEISKQL